MLDANNQNPHLEEIKLPTLTIETDRDLPHIQETEITRLLTEDLIQETEIILTPIADHIRQIETEKDLGIIHLQEEIIPETEVDRHLEADTITTNHPHHHQDPSQEAIQQEEEQNLYQIQVQRQSLSRSTVKNTFLSVRKTNNGLSLIFVEYPSIK